MARCHDEVRKSYKILIPVAYFHFWRGRILTAPYENRDGWEMNVMLVNDTMYFEEHLTAAKLIEK